MTSISSSDALSYCDDYYAWSSILSFLLGVSRQELILGSELFLTPSLYQRFEELYTLYAHSHKPLAYILWCEEFAWRNFMVNQSVLIPRPESEYFLETVSSFFHNHTLVKSAMLVDLGTGSWCLGISLVSLLDSYFHVCYLVDISVEALEVAQWNASHLLSSHQQNKVCCIQSDLLAFLLSEPLSPTFDCVVIVANLPYVPLWFSGLEKPVEQWEPALALFSGEDWLLHYKRLMADLSRLQENHYFSCGSVVFMEMMRDQYSCLSSEYYFLWQWCSYPTFHDNIVIGMLVLG